MGHIEYPARTERKAGYQHTYYPHAQETAKATASTSQGTRCWQMPSLCSTSQLKPIRNFFFGSGFASAGKISLLTQQQQAFCEGSVGLSLLSPQGQSRQIQEPSRDPGEQTSDLLLACLESWPLHSGPCHPLHGMAGALSCSHLASPGHRRPMLLAFANKMEEERAGELWRAQKARGAALCGDGGNSPRSAPRMVPLQHGVNGTAEPTQASVPSAGSLTCRWDRA